MVLRKKPKVLWKKTTILNRKIINFDLLWEKNIVLWEKIWYQEKKYETTPKTMAI